ncbi:ester hydrolase C11orf54 homolog isoform X1 [Parasteatoda tepidariorum]|uniref:ester hydrolase C11orf54 homolog isoform X1 n=1 Tax=Parasteatoda tepidariorum TaxID=114398 RepID=UPI001C7186D3|nr:ester hydrolase C11orf54 homolog isoform X1 [Parasteatoda tepidariorum]
MLEKVEKFRSLKIKDPFSRHIILECYLICADYIYESALQKGLLETFNHVDVKVVDCPDMREKPFMLSAEGICERPCLADVGGVEYLAPLAQKDKVYDFKLIAESIDMPTALMIGAGAGPRPHIGTNCEMMANVKLGDEDLINTRIAKITEDGSELIHLKDSTKFCLLGNLYVSEGKPGKVIKVVAKERKGSENFVTAMRKILADYFKDKPVGIGGVFIIKKGKAKLHIMPDYSDKPLRSDDDINNWLKFFNMSAPLTCLSTFVSHDPGLNLRVEHTHCFSDHNEGGHYHYDITPDSVEYEGYFNVCHELFRIDRPSTRQEFGRD